MKKREEDFRDDEFNAPLPDQPQKQQQSTFRQYRLPICGLAVLVILVIGFVVWQMWNTGQNTQLTAYTPPVQQVPAPSQQTRRPEVPQALIVPESPTANSQQTEYIEKMSQTLEGIKLDIAAIKACTGSAAPQDNDSANLLAMIQEMTNDLKKLTESKKQLTQALQASERKIDELTQDNSKLKTSMENAKKSDTMAAQTAKKDKKASPSANSNLSDLKAELKTWKVIGLSANRVVLTDKSGKIHNMGVGDALGNIKIQAVDLESGNIKTTAGSLSYGE